MDISKTSVMAAHRLTFERLEPRVFLCSTAAEMIAVGVPASMVTEDGHIREADFQTLSPELQKHIDPHLIQGSLSDGPVDFDKLLGIPTSVSGAREGGSEADSVPRLVSGGQRHRSRSTRRAQPGRTLVNFPTAINNQGTGPGHRHLRSPGHRSHPNRRTDHELAPARRQPGGPPAYL